MRKFLSVILALLFAVPFTVFASAKGVDEGMKFDNEATVKVDGTDQKVASGKTIVYENNTDETRYCEAEDYNFRYADVFVFDRDGKLIETGCNLVARSEKGSPQFGIKVPAGGFSVASMNVAPLTLLRNYAMQGAMLYNATMSVIREAYCVFDKENMAITVKYNNAKAPSADAKKYLFVGNSTTYFNGTPVKFQGLCEAAGINVDVQYCTFGSAFLSEFANPEHERGRALREKLAGEKYDYVCFHDAASTEYGALLENSKIILSLIEKNGATPLLYMRYGEGIDDQDRHHALYTKLSNKLGIKCSPSADAYKICLKTHPEIELMADDNAHHSKEGSYLIACTWLYTFTGTDPRGNSYDAQLDPEVAKILQDIAYEACNNYKPDEEEEVVPYEMIDGTKYELISYEKSYTVTGSVYSNKNWTDADGNGKPIGKLTNGAFANSGNDMNIGCWMGSTQNMIIDLGEKMRIKEFMTDLYGNAAWGIGDPEKAVITIYVSDDGKEFNKVNTLQGLKKTAEGDWVGKKYKLVLGETVEARYVKFGFELDGNFCWSSELAVYGLKNDQQAPIDAHPEENIPENKGGEKGNTWLYILIAIIALLAIAAAAIIITKKLK